MTFTQWDDSVSDWPCNELEGDCCLLAAAATETTTA
eukprot:CAMPEP_0115093290 /NCGR_PEP_ID=MMETSP0227-20121206/27424_1 /TAXON_ID=89957 /ORGANISM="Polarella glacialis, Strain CCMP 1383" /LENGTH=35 /DNA_ID= /DNA_START= /DNA_END= /DNA_ORIENTATION=